MRQRGDRETREDRERERESESEEEPVSAH